jgi:RimJ/RimL family protein N-acetyltransferase
MIFSFKENYVLENNVVRLTPLLEEDFGKLVPFANNEPDLWEYSLVQATSEEGLKNYLKLAIESRKNENAYPFLVFDKRTNQFAGSTRFYDIQLAQNTVQLGFTWYGKAFQRTGLNQNCKFLLLEFAFEKMNLDRVEFRADNDNTKSIVSMKNIGCTQEGILRNHGYKPDRTRRDSIVLSILKDEWFNSVKANLQNKISG